jgi:hypothetical protein
MPVLHHGVRYNCRMLCLDRKIVLVWKKTPSTHKSYLALIEKRLTTLLAVDHPTYPPPPPAWI